MIAFALLFALYQGLKLAVYSRFPFTNYDEWVVRDTAMNGPRVIVGCLALWWAWRRWGPRRIGLHGRGAAAALLVLAMELLFLAAHGLEPAMKLRQQLVLAGSSLLVAFNEEALFRALGLEALREKFGERTAFWGSTLLFTVYHYGAQPLAGWPYIFLCGLIFARMRLDGVSLLWLMFIHAAYDGVFDIFRSPAPFGYLIIFPIVFSLILLAYLKLFRFRENAAHS